jgi:hypothetical protein
MVMDKQLEHRIRERAYELWMQHGGLPGRAEEYWYQAEREILGETSPQQTESTAKPDEVSVEVNSAPLGMISETSDEVMPAPAAPKTRKRRSSSAPASTPAPEEGSEASATVPPKRRKSTRTP